MCRMHQLWSYGYCLRPYLKHDIDTGLIDEDEAYRYVKSLWTMIEIEERR